MWRHFSLPSEGAKALLECGADPLNVGKIGQSPAQVAQSSNARDVIKVLQVCSKDIYLQHYVILFQDWGKERKEVGILKIVVDGAGFKELNQEYHATSPQEIPTGLVGCSVELCWLIIQALNGFAGRRVGTRQIRGRNSMEIQFGSKPQLRWFYFLLCSNVSILSGFVLQLHEIHCFIYSIQSPPPRPTSTGTSPTVFGGSMSPVGTVFTLPRLLPGLLHRQAGSPSDPLGLCLVLWPLSETCEILY